ncbi:MAG: zinc ABC transporter substrate-binding protein, partial [Clostridia bacterium]|nr:zinc ABC transporter substrate-binding protein [Clostridia bacterium]
MTTFRRLTALILLAALLAGCNLMAGDTAPDTTRVMTTFYPLYILALNLTKDVPALILSNLVQPQTGCPRTYQLSDWDAALIAGQDALIIGGRGLESFESALNAASSGPVVLTAMSGLALHNGGVANEESTHLEGDNPWLFLSVPGAMEMSISIAAGMGQLDEPYAGVYAANLREFLMRLENLADDMENALSRAPSRSVAVLHEGLGYLARQLKLDIVCEYPREPGTEQYGADLDDLLEALETSGAEVILIERQAPQNLVETLEAAGYTVARLDTLMT